MKSVFLAAPFFIGLSVAFALAKPAQLEDKGVKPLEVPTTTIIPTQELSGGGATSPSETLENEGEDEKVKAAEPLDTGPAPEVMYDSSLLPRPVARMRSQLMDAALSGDAERLRMVFESNEVPPTLSFVAIDDPIDFIRESSGDGEGREVLAILADVLDAGFVHVDVGTAQEMYVWPYFARYPLHKLTPEQKVEMFRIVTSGDFAEMELNGVWLFYRVGIGPDGTLHYFVAGE